MQVWSSNHYENCDRTLLELFNSSDHRTVETKQKHCRFQMCTDLLLVSVPAWGQSRESLPRFKIYRIWVRETLKKQSHLCAVTHAEAQPCCCSVWVLEGRNVRLSGKTSNASLWASQQPLMKSTPLPKKGGGGGVWVWERTLPALQVSR